jgi:hypothetical protein
VKFLVGGESVADAHPQRRRSLHLGSRGDEPLARDCDRGRSSWHGFDSCDIAAPFGLNDLLNLVLRPTPYFPHEKRGIYANRLQTKR